MNGKRFALPRLSLSPAALYAEARLPRDVARSLNLMLMGNLCGNMWSIICGGGTTAMIGLANELGAGDLAFGFLSGIPQAAALMQIPFSLLVNRTHKRKRYLLTYGLISRVMWLGFGFIPLLIPISPERFPLFTLIFLLGISSCLSSAINVCWFPWFSELAPIGIRGRWFGFRDTISSACNLGIGILSARLLDTLPPRINYMVVFALGGIIGIIDMICFGFCKEVYAAPPRKLRFRDMLKDVTGNRPFMRLTVMWTAWCFTCNLAAPYLGRYSVNEMGLSFTQLMIFGTAAASVAAMLVMRKWGSLLDRFGCRSVMIVSTLLTSLTDLFYLFSAPGSVWPVFLRNFTGAMLWSGCNMAATNMQLTTSPEETRPSHIAVFSCVTALVGTTLGTLTGGVLLEGFATLPVFSGGFDRYKALILLGSVLRLAVAGLLTRPLENDKEGTPGELIRSFGQVLRLHRK